MLLETPSRNFRRSAYTSPAPPESERDKLITAHLSKVRYIADRIASNLPPSVEREDLYSAGVIGLIEAVERYDASRGIAFTTFAEMRVRGAILDSLRMLDTASRSLRRRGRELQAAYAAVEQQKGRAASEEEVAANLKISVTELRENLQALNSLKVVDLDERDERTGLSVLDTIFDTRATPLETFEEDQKRKILAQAIGSLPERERQVIALYYIEELNMKEIGAVLNISESRVSQLRTQAIIRLRGKFSNSLPS